MFPFPSPTASSRTAVSNPLRLRVSGIVSLIPLPNQFTVCLTILGVPHSFTLVAPTAATRMNKQIISAIGMARWALRLAGILSRWIVAPQHIDGVRNWLKVIGVHTRGITTQMIQFQAIGDRADPHFVSESGRFGRAAIVAIEGTVAVFVPGTHPRPATIWLGNDDMQQESINGMHGPSISQASGYNESIEDLAAMITDLENVTFPERYG